MANKVDIDELIASVKDPEYYPKCLLGAMETSIGSVIRIKEGEKYFMDADSSMADWCTVADIIRSYLLTIKHDGIDTTSILPKEKLPDHMITGE